VPRRLVFFLFKIISGQTTSPNLNSKEIKEDHSKMGGIGYTETSLTFYQYTLCITQYLPRWCLHLNVVGESESFRDPESYAGGSLATGRDTQARQVKG